MRIPGAELKTAAWLVGVLALHTFIGLTLALFTITDRDFSPYFS